MNKYLIEILKNHSSLILPGIGALMVTNRKTGDIKFNPHLTFNDGALASFIANEENIDKAEAQNKVAKFTSEIKTIIDKGDTYDIFEFGTIFKDNNGEISFKMAKDSAANELNKTLSKDSDSENKNKPADNIVERAKEVKDAASDAIKSGTDKISDKTKEITDKGAKAAKEASDKLSDIAHSAKNKVADAAEQTSGILKKSADKAAEKVEKITKKGAASLSSATDKTIQSAKDSAETISEKTKETVDKIVDKSEEVKNTYIPPVDKDKLPEVPKIVASTADSASKSTEKVVEKTKETVTATAEYVEEKRRRWWPLILLLLIIGLAVAAYFFRDKIKSYLGWNDKTKIENVNNYPDADGDGIPDFADVDLTGGTDADGDGIDDLADLDYTNGVDSDGDGIDDAFANAALGLGEETETDPLAMADEDGDGIPDFADINSTNGVDENNNGVDDKFDAAITLGADSDKDCIDDSLANVALLNHLKGQLPDSDGNGIPDYADIALTGGEDINKNGIDDAFEAVDGDKNKDGLNDSILLAMATGGINVGQEIAANTVDTEEMVSDETSTEPVDEPAEIEEIVEEKPIVTKPETTSKPTSSTKSDYSATGNYHAIGAAFAEKSNAINYTSDMVSKGFSASIIGRFDGLYLVSLKQYSSLGEAKTDLSNMRNTSSSAWIFKH